jgi:hypothetical protein
MGIVLIDDPKQIKQLKKNTTMVEPFAGSSGMAMVN